MIYIPNKKTETFHIPNGIISMACCTRYANGSRNPPYTSPTHLRSVNRSVMYIQASHLECGFKYYYAEIIMENAHLLWHVHAPSKRMKIVMELYLLTKNEPIGLAVTNHSVPEIHWPKYVHYSAIRASLPTN